MNIVLLPCDRILRGTLQQKLRCFAALAFAISLSFAGSPEVSAQDTDTHPVATAAPVPDQKIGPPFEVASIRPANTNDGRRMFGTQITDSGRFIASAVSLNNLIYSAFEGYTEQGKVEGGPAWAKTDSYDIDAKLDDAQLEGWDRLTYAQRFERIQPMLRQLIVERFRLKLHTEMRETAVYAMIQAKGGARLKPVDPPPEVKAFADQPRADGKTLSKGAQPGGTMMTGNSWQGNAIRPVMLTGQIGYSSHLDTLVIDETGLTGFYDFSMTIDYSKDAPLFQDQVEEQLGLKLIPKKVPIRTWVIDSAEKPSQDGA